MTSYYLRKRRLAMLFAGLSVALLALNLAAGLFIRTYWDPRVAPDGEGFRFIWKSKLHDQDEHPRTGVLETDGELRPRAAAAPLGGDATAVLAGGEETVLFFGARYAVLKGGSSLRGAALDQTWEVRAAVRDRARDVDWVFGQSGSKIVARRRELGTFSEPLEVADASGVERLVACLDRGAGPLVAWRERGSELVKAVLHDGRRFVPRAEFRIGAAQLWDVALAGPRVLLVTYDREDRTFTSVGLRLRCCPGCPAPRPSALLRFGDPVLFIGKLVTGVAATSSGDRLVLAVTRWTSAQSAVVPVDTPGSELGPLRPLHQEPRWRTSIAFFFPFTMLFFSFSLVFLGFALLRERGHFVLEKLAPAATEGPIPAAILQRAMAFILDLLVVLPLFWFVVQAGDFAPDVAVSLSDPTSWPLWALLALLHALYGLAMEGTLGWTVGKKVIGLRAAELDGGRLTFRGALVRNLARFLDAAFPIQIFLGMTTLMTSRRRQRLGDVLARTMVVEDRPVPAERPSPPRREPETVERR